jgi:hypothetical protein
MYAPITGGKAAARRRLCPVSSSFPLRARSCRLDPQPPPSRASCIPTIARGPKGTQANATPRCTTSTASSARCWSMPRLSRSPSSTTSSGRRPGSPKLHNDPAERPRRDSTSHAVGAGNVSRRHDRSSAPGQWSESLRARVCVQLRRGIPGRRRQRVSARGRLPGLGLPDYGQLRRRRGRQDRRRRPQTAVVMTSRRDRLTAGSKSHRAASRGSPSTRHDHSSSSSTAAAQQQHSSSSSSSRSNGFLVIRCRDIRPSFIEPSPLRARIRGRWLREPGIAWPHGPDRSGCISPTSAIA